MAKLHVLPEFSYSDVVYESQIRLMRIDKINEENIIECTLTCPIDRDRTPSFFALSWCWGILPEDREIVLNGSRFWINQNLLEALHAIYALYGKLNERPYIWIDRVCINQEGRVSENEFQEKPGQVRNMHKLYKMATCVIIWLGREESSDRLGILFTEWLFRYMRLPIIEPEALASYVVRLHQAFKIESLEEEIKTLYGIEPIVIQAVAVLIDELTRHNRTDTQSFQNLIETVEILQNLPNEGHPLWKSLNQLRNRPYYKRVWTFQEAALAHQKAIFVCGDRHIPWYMFKDAENALKKCGPFRKISGSFARKLIDVVDYKYIAWPEGASFQSDYEIARHFSQLLLILNGRRSKDKRDFVYAILGLVSDSVRSRIKIDYLYLKPADVFVQATTLLFELDGSLSWYWYLVTFLIRSEPSIECLPSWCPDFSNPPISSVNESTFPEKFALPPRSQRSLFNLRTDNVLELRGLSIGIVRKSMVICSEFNTLTPSSCHKNIGDWLIHLRGFTHDFNEYMNATNMWEKFDTLISKSGVENIPFQDLSVWAASVESQVNDETWESFCKGAGRLNDLDTKPFLNLLSSQTGRYFFFTEAGQLGFSPRKLAKGDRICYFSGSRFLQAINSDSKRLVSYAVIDEMMSYTALGLPEGQRFDKRADLESFSLQ